MTGFDEKIIKGAQISDKLYELFISSDGERFSIKVLSRVGFLGPLTPEFIYNYTKCFHLLLNKIKMINLSVEHRR